MGQKKTFNGTSGNTGGSPQLVGVIKDAIAGAILDGRYPRGARLPTNTEIQQHWRVSARTSRRVLAELTQEGWAVAEGTRGYTSTGGPAPATGQPPAAPYPGTVPGALPPSGPARPRSANREADDGTDTYDPATDTRHPTGRPLGQDPTMPDPNAGAPPPAAQLPPAAPAAHIPPPGPASGPPAAPMPRPSHTIPAAAHIPVELSAVRIVSAGYEPAPMSVAYALRMDGPGLPVLVRRRLITNPGGTIPLELRTSYTPGIGERSPLAQPAALPGTWHANLAAHTPHRPTAVTAHISTRPATGYEAAALQLPPGAYVLVRVSTTTNRNGDPIDQTVSIWPETTTVYADNQPIN